MTKNYAPAPGTIPARVIEFLRKHPRGAEFSSAEITAALKLNAEGFGTAIYTATRHRLIEHRKVDMRSFWSLSKNIELLPASSDDAAVAELEEVLKVRQSIVSAAGAPSLASGRASPFPTASVSTQPEEPEPDEDLEEDAPPAAPRAPWPFAAASTAPLRAQEVADALDEIEALPDGPAAASAPFRCALWSSGEFALQSASGSVLLGVDETRQLVAYIERLAVQE